MICLCLVYGKLCMRRVVALKTTCAMCCIVEKSVCVACSLLEGVYCVVYLWKVCGVLQR